MIKIKYTYQFNKGFTLINTYNFIGDFNFIGRIGIL